MKYIIKQRDLELLKEYAIKNKNGLSNFTLVQNIDKNGREFRFRVVCEQVNKVEEILNKLKTNPQKLRDVYLKE